MSEAGPFGGAATKVADANALKTLIEKTAAQHEGEADDRKTREVDPAEFRALLRQQAEAAPADVAGGTERAPAPAASADVAGGTERPLEPPMAATFDDGLDFAFADPDAGANVASPAAASTLASAVDAESIQAPAVAVREPAPERAIAVPSHRQRSARTLVIAAVALLALAVLVVVLALPLV